MLVTKSETEEQLLDAEEWEIEQLEYNKNEELQKLSFLDVQIDDLKCDLADLEFEREEIVSEVKEYQKGIDEILKKRLEREYKVYLKVLWYKCLITENQTTLDIFGLKN